MKFHLKPLETKSNLHSNFEEVTEAEPEDPGVLVFTPWTQLLYMNRRAAELSYRLIPLSQNPSEEFRIPPEVIELVDEVVGIAGLLYHREDWSQVQRTRIVDNLEPTIILRAFGIPDPKGVLYSRIMILMEETKMRQGRVLVNTKQQFRLTDREYTVFQYLARGFTNKGIALGLKLAEGTVKKHVKSIMRKTGAQTRTGVLGKCLHVDP